MISSILSRHAASRAARLSVLLTMALAGVVSAATAIADGEGSGGLPGGLTPAPEALRYCVVCHGVELMGNRAVDAPRLAGLPAWYLDAQMKAFRKGWRGTHAEDATGMEMRPQAAVLSDEEVSRAVAFAAAARVTDDAVMAPPRWSEVSGDADQGARLYQPCAACHGARGEGIESLHAPPLAGQSDWYLVTQLRHFRSGARGTAPGDTQGAVMRASAAALTSDAAIDDVVSYITTLASDALASQANGSASNKTDNTQ